MGLVITISGPHGSGKTTYAKFIAKRFNLRYISAGSLFRKIAREKNIDLEELSRIAQKDLSIDREIDRRTVEEAKKGNVVLDGQLTGWFAKDVADIKILINTPFEERVKRIAEREKKSYDQAYRETKIREESEIDRFKSLYNIDLSDWSIYDAILNSATFSINSLNEILTQIIQSYEKSNRRR